MNDHEVSDLVSRVAEKDVMTRWRGIIEEYRKFLTVTAQTPVITLGEGNTPLIRAARLAKKIAPGVDLYLKYEGMNPTGSFKDRGMTMAISKAVEGGARAVICASTGNTSASAAAYGARAGIAVYVLIPAGKIALGKVVASDDASSYRHSSRRKL